MKKNNNGEEKYNINVYYTQSDMNKKNNIKIGVVNCFQIKNYGSVLQSYATQKIVQDLGYEVESIYYNKDKSFKQIMNYLPQLMLPSVIKMKYKNIKKSMKKEMQYVKDCIYPFGRAALQLHLSGLYRENERAGAEYAAKGDSGRL